MVANCHNRFRYLLGEKCVHPNLFLTLLKTTMKSHRLEAAISPSGLCRRAKKADGEQFLHHYVQYTAVLGDIVLSIYDVHL